VIQSRFYNVRGVKWEACFFSKGAVFPDTDVLVPRQGVWARPAQYSWDSACYVADSWRFVRMEHDVLYMPETK
jgi:hypothetical protein